MKFYAIPPNKHLDLMENGDSYFCLAHHYKSDANYRNHFLNLKQQHPNAWITLDNGCAEHSTVSEEELLQIVSELKPNEVIPPDVLFDYAQTMTNFRSFVSKMNTYGFMSHTAIFACPQGETKSVWLQCFYEMLVTPFVKCIGLSKIAVPKCWNNALDDKLIGLSRNQCVQDLIDKKLLLRPLHLLGMGEHEEFSYYLHNKIPFIRSSDSCYTILAAINGISFESGDNTRIPTTNDYFNSTLTESQIDLAKRNINYLKTNYKNI